MLILVSCAEDKPIVPVPGNTVDQHSGDIPTRWYQLSLELTKETPGFSPPVAARAFGYTGIALYEALLPGMPEFRSLAGQISELNAGYQSGVDVPETIHWQLVANKVLANMAINFYGIAHAPNIAKIESLEQTLFQREIQNLEPHVISQSLNYAMDISSLILAYAQRDGQSTCWANNFPDDFELPVFPGSWIPTPPLYQHAMLPNWGAVRPFIEANVTQTQPPLPPVYSSSPTSLFYAQALEVYAAVNEITPEQEIITWFWSDDPGKSFTPPGHSISVLTQILDIETADLSFAAHAYMLLGIGLHDAFISCWKCKYDVALVRPVTYIREYIDGEFNSILSTPPFPEYTSGHSVQIGAASVILTHLFGDQYAFTDRSHVNRMDIDGSPRTFYSFHEMAEEAAISRLYGGIHYRDAIVNGLSQGRKIGSFVAGLNVK
jgi:hypothetical protein